MSNIRSEAYTIGPVVLGYVDSQNSSLFAGKKNDSGDETYGCMAIFSEDVRAQIQPIVDQIGNQAFPQEWSNPHANLKRAIHNSQEKQQIAPIGPYFMNVSSKFQPQVVDASHQPIVNTLDPMTGRKPIYDGVIAYISVTVFSFANKSKGVAIGLNAVMKFADGQPLSLSTGVDVATAFANVPAAPPANAQPPQQAPQGGYQQQPAYGPAQGQAPAPGGYQQQPAQAPAYGPAQGQAPQGYPPQGVPPYQP